MTYVVNVNQRSSDLLVDHEPHSPFARARQRSGYDRGRKPFLEEPLAMAVFSSLPK
jgi:hypothetical protein